MGIQLVTRLVAGCVLLAAAAPALFAQDSAEEIDFSYPTELEDGFHVFGMESGYFLFPEPVEVDGRFYDSIMFQAPLPQCEQYDGQVILYHGYTVEHLAVDEERFVFRATGEDLPDYEFVLILDEAGADAWFEGASHIEHLGTARLTQGEHTVITPVWFWIGD
ncbi:hypothetical protein [Maricaulis sp. MIT060901]|uniref:hypothetical protein n=1 Tax=Maricaulis sp. MIT060901 TaxID=3096993 RepID=UPI00399BE894